MNILESLMTIHPRSIDCVKGHVGYPVVTEEYEHDDDRAWVIKVKRCSHCKLVLGEEQ